MAVDVVGTVDGGCLLFHCLVNMEFGVVAVEDVEDVEPDEVDGVVIGFI